MSALRAQPGRLVQASVALFRALLLLYPARFRRAYGEPMRQVFRASLLDAAQRGGAAGIAQLWLRTLGDLLLTALAERLEFAMTQAPSARPGWSASSASSPGSSAPSCLAWGWRLQAACSPRLSA